MIKELEYIHHINESRGKQRNKILERIIDNFKLLSLIDPKSSLARLVVKELTNANYTDD